MRIRDACLALAAMLLLLPHPGSAQPLLEDLPGYWSGHLRARGRVSEPEEGSVYSPAGGDTLHDWAGELRLKWDMPLENRLSFTVHYVNAATGGATRESLPGLAAVSPALAGSPVIPGGSVDDDTRALDLTATLDEDEDFLWYHRIDRLCLAYNPTWGNVRVGRQAVTLGNGLIFNPMDLFNPFSPTNVERDYKTGDDMVFVELIPQTGMNLQFLYVPRRDPDGDLSPDYSSVAAKARFPVAGLEVDVLASRHFEDTVVGAGASGYLGASTWRADLVWGVLHDEPAPPGVDQKDTYAAVVANLDRSWMYKGKNFYGLLEFYHNTLLDNDYATDTMEPAVARRLEYGELHSLGSTYLAGSVQMEAHPLVNLYLTMINNLADPSGALLPRVEYSARQNLQVTLGANLFWGGSGTEYGGWTIPGTSLSTAPPQAAYAWATWYF